MTAIALVVIVAAMVLVRIGWGGRAPVAATGWLLGGAALAALTVADGAWGMAMGCVAGMTAALVLVLHAGWASPARTSRPPREAPSVAMPIDRRDLLRRIGVFVLVVPVAFAAAQWAAYGIQALARRSGAVEADAIVLMLFLQPTIWGIVMSIQMTRASIARMATAPAVAAILGTLLWSVA